MAHSSQLLEIHCCFFFVNRMESKRTKRGRWWWRRRRRSGKTYNNEKKKNPPSLHVHFFFHFTIVLPLPSSSLYVGAVLFLQIEFLDRFRWIENAYITLINSLCLRTTNRFHAIFSPFSLAKLSLLIRIKLLKFSIKVFFSGRSI